MSLFHVATTLLRQVPPEHRLALAQGALKLTGSVLRETKTGRIVGFLQEAGPIAKPLSGALGKGVSAFASTGNAGLAAGTVAADLAMQAGRLMQNAAIQKDVNRVEASTGRIEEGVGRIEDKLDTMDGKLDGLSNQFGQGVDLLSNLGIANLALSASGLGISVVGFGVMTAKLNRVQETLRGMGDRIGMIGSQIERVRQDLIDADFVQIHSLTSLYEESWQFGDKGRAEQQWLRINQDARTLQDRFVRRAHDLLTEDIGNMALADAMLDSATLASGLRVAALAACNEAPMAISVAQEAASQVEMLTGSIGLVELSALNLNSQAEAGSSDYELAMIEARDAARPLLEKIRGREAATATRAAPLPLLQHRGIAPREWLEEARSEREAPILMLSADESETTS
ncbi:hypothetical protein [Novosphingobium decolorationis]|uniref:Uncharacterized protein n=1 Tax=Novosphingobium decolorationis TaxID=2698673 RepID=A0ABX8E7L9_9SPHN|nr:hypothetical protein [Novosphingobium decolorationis]QVM85172.1 hypothetical protein HT578_17045 [Novosphingobium decolorationis]